MNENSGHQFRKKATEALVKVFDIKLGPYLGESGSLEIDIQTFLEEVSMNLEHLKKKKDHLTISDIYLEKLQLTINAVMAQYDTSQTWVQAWSDVLDNMDRFYLQKKYLDNILTYIQNVRYEITEKMINTAKSTGGEKVSLTLTERLILVRCLQDEGICTRPSQLISKTELDTILGYILGEHPSSIKSSTAKAQKFLTKSTMSRDEKKSFSASILNVKQAMGLPEDHIIPKRLTRRLDEIERQNPTLN
jgi:hypothetical protein